MDEKQVIGLLARQLHTERLLTLSLMEESQELLEIVSSEIPIEDETRQSIEKHLIRLRAALSSFREELQGPPSDSPQPKT